MHRTAILSLFGLDAPNALTPWLCFAWKRDILPPIQPRAQSYYRRYAADRKRHRGDNERIRCSDGDGAWEFMAFTTRFEMLCALRCIESDSLCDDSLSALLLSLLAVLRSHRDFQKRCALVGLNRLCALCVADERLSNALHSFAPLLLDALRIAMAFRVEALSAQLFPLLIALIANLDARKEEIARALGRFMGALIPRRRLWCTRRERPMRGGSIGCCGIIWRSAKPRKCRMCGDGAKCLGR